VDDALLPRDSPDEQHDGTSGFTRGGPAPRRRRRPVLGQVDAVVDHAHALGRHAVERLDVALHRARHGDHAIRVAVRVRSIQLDAW